jgi:hypothetical protein
MHRNQEVDEGKEPRGKTKLPNEKHHTELDTSKIVHRHASLENRG